MKNFFHKNLTRQHLDGLKIKGIPSLKKSLEKEFFANVDIKLLKSFNHFNCITIAMDCNFKLHEALFQLNNFNWGNLNNHPLHTSNFLKEQIQTISFINNSTFHLTELAINFTDTTLVINKIQGLLIEDNLSNILDSLSQNYVNLTKGLKKMPFEMYTTVFELDELANNVSQNTPFMDYLYVWGVYFSDEEAMQIYDVQNKKFMQDSAVDIIDE